MPDCPKVSFYVHCLVPESQNLLFPDSSSNMGVCLIMTKMALGFKTCRSPVSRTFCDAICRCFYVQAKMVFFLDCDGPYYLKLCQVAREENSKVVSKAVMTQ